MPPQWRNVSFMPVSGDRSDTGVPHMVSVVSFIPFKSERSETVVRSSPKCSNFHAREGRQVFDFRSGEVQSLKRHSLQWREVGHVQAITVQNPQVHALRAARGH